MSVQTRRARVDLGGKVAVVTGASSGIGRGVAIGLMNAGATVWMVGRHESSLRSAASDFRDPDELARYCKADLMDRGDIAELADRVTAAGEAVDVLVHCAGVIRQGPVAKSPVEWLEEQFNLNVRAPYLVTQALLDGLKRTRGQVVFINSSIVFNPREEQALYSATKHALWGLADCLRREVNGDGVRVLTVFPGRTASRMQKEMFEREGRAYVPEALMQPEDIAEVVISALTLPRTAEVTDIHMRPMKKG